MTLIVACGASERIDDPEADRDRESVRGDDDDDDADGSEAEALLAPEDLPPGSVTQAGDAGVAAGTVSDVAAAGIEVDPNLTLPVVAQTVEDSVGPDPNLTSVELPEDITVPGPGVLIDDRADVPALAPSDETAACERIEVVTFQRQRTTPGMGVQLSVGVRGPGGLPLSSASYAGCLDLRNAGGESLSAVPSSSAASNALTVLLIQPGTTDAENLALAEAAIRLFMSRPRGERMAAYRWGQSVDQVVDFTRFRDTFSDALLTRMPLEDGVPVDSSVAVTRAEEALDSVADDSWAWARNVVVLAPRVAAVDLVTFVRNSNVIWAVDAADVSGFRYVHTSGEAPSDAMGQVSARLTSIREEGFVTFGLCGQGEVQAAQVVADASGTVLPVELKDALEEEVAGACSPQEVAAFDYHDTRLIQLAFTDEQRAIYDEAVDERDDELDFDVTLQLSPDHGFTPTLAHLRGGTSLTACADDRVNYSIDLGGGRERFFFPEGSGSVGSDEFYLTAMCLDEMYINQLGMDRLMAELGTFVSGAKLVEVRVDGSSQGVYLLMEQVKEALLRNHAELTSAVRRRNRTSEVKYPGVDDPAAQELALMEFEALAEDVSGLSGAERLEVLRSRLDLHRYMFFTAFQSVVHNGDWVDEPTLYSTATLSGGGVSRFFSINGWDPDDVLKGECAHANNVISDPFDLLGCAEHTMEMAIFGGDSINGDEIIDDEVFALYVDALQVTLDHFTEERIGAAYDQTGAELKVFTGDPDIVSVMEFWSEEDDVDAALDAAIAQRKQAFADRRALLLNNLAAYRGSR